MKKGLFGGSFDPVHNGHVNLVKHMKKALGLSHVLIVPAYVSPFKVQNPPKASGAHRLAMLNLAFEGLEGVEVSDLEIRKGGVSYTVETLRKLEHDEPEHRYFLLLFEEMLSRFHEWKDSEEIQKLSTPAFAMYTEGHKTSTAENFQFVKIPKVEVSSTEVRDHLKQSLSIDHFVPPKVASYIQEHKLYYDSLNSE